MALAEKFCATPCGVLQEMVDSRSVLWGTFATISLFGFYFLVVSTVQNVSFTLLNLRTYWYLILPLLFGFGLQVGLFVSIQRTVALTGAVVGSGGFSAGSMVACCSHFLLSFVPFFGISGLAPFLIQYQPWFLGFGIFSNLIGIALLLRHQQNVKGGFCRE